MMATPAAFPLPRRLVRVRCCNVQRELVKGVPKTGKKSALLALAKLT